MRLKYRYTQLVHYSFITHVKVDITQVELRKIIVIVNSGHAEHTKY